jgi:hypothetical protein
MAHEPRQISEELARALKLFNEPSTDKTHYEVLGRFIVAFANAEGVVHVLTRKLSGLSDDKARILFGGMRLGDVIDRLRQFMNLDDMPKETFDEIDDCLSQLAKISDRRHRLVHRGSRYSKDGLTSTNFMTSRSIQHIEIDNFPEQLLKDLMLDAAAIFLRLYAILRPEKASAQTLAIMKSRSWQYRPAPPATRSRARRKTRAKRKPQPLASHE